MTSTAIYIIRIKGHLDESWSDWLDGMAIQPEPYGETSIAGPVRDQAALVGLINQLYDLGLVLISVIPQE
jgi:hypothetical protein